MWHLSKQQRLLINCNVKVKCFCYQQGEIWFAMASASASGERGDQTVPGGEEKEEEDRGVRDIQSHYLRCPSPRYETT